MTCPWTARNNTTCRNCSLDAFVPWQIAGRRCAISFFVTRRNEPTGFAGIIKLSVHFSLNARLRSQVEKTSTTRLRGSRRSILFAGDSCLVKIP